MPTVNCGPQQLSRYSDWLRAGRSGDRIPVEARFSAPVQTGPGAHPASCTMGTGSFPGIKNGRGVTVTPHPLLVPWSRKSRAIPLLPLWAIRPVQSLSACTRVHFTGMLVSPQPDHEGNKLMFLSEWRELPSAPCLARWGGGGGFKIAHVTMLLKSHASLTCFRACFLPGRAKDLSAPRYTDQTRGARWVRMWQVWEMEKPKRRDWRFGEGGTEFILLRKGT